MKTKNIITGALMLIIILSCYIFYNFGVISEKARFNGDLEECCVEWSDLQTFGTEGYVMYMEYVKCLDWRMCKKG